MKKLALITGINYRGHKDELNGCINDASDILRKLVEEFNFKTSDIQLLIEEVATRKNILEGLEYLVGELEPGDIGVFTYSGHGTQTADLPPIGEDDMKDEAIVPIDAINNHSYLIRDDEIHEILSKLKANVHFVVIFDSCNSETGTRGLGSIEEEKLIKLRSSISEIKSIDELNKVVNDLSSSEIDNSEISIRSIPPLETIDEIQNIMGNINIPVSEFRKRGDREHPLSGFNHILLAGCKADQSSIDNGVNGLFTKALIENMKKGITYQELYDLAYKRVHELNNTRYVQDPQLEGPDYLLNQKIFEWKITSDD
ncbi:caspase family protein [Priestia megaterium]|uniref:caspase family protein n=1 Tax=Priestia megaterium TaxID=1404 RepID=UPI002499CA65|nr:caspase family protein [Priestia megaterium]MDI3090373.1 caspase family protein [Priestia megaterium]